MDTLQILKFTLLLSVSGVAGSAVPNTIKWRGNFAVGCEFKGNDLARKKVPGEDCGALCMATTNCTHFTWSDWDGGTCFLKRNLVRKTTAIPTGNSSSVCGVVTEGPEFESGTTTRFWDCCKPSCSWPGKAEVTNPVKTCGKDGVTQVHNPDAPSGCDAEGGEAYPCNDQMPWVINDTLAYGFAGASILGYTEKSWCCACYRLDFTSDPVRGKTMIVQATNYGGDMRTNQFNLQIPGSGMGLHDGCTTQWGSSKAVWGATYGGVWERTGCDRLPEQLQEGCRFRFEWLRGANNPKVNFVKVNCPPELTERSQCTRTE